MNITWLLPLVTGRFTWIHSIWFLPNMLCCHRQGVYSVFVCHIKYCGVRNHTHEVEHPDSFSHQLYEFQIGSIVDYRSVGISEVSLEAFYIVSMQGDTYRVIFAWNDADPNSQNALIKHSQRGVKSIILLDYSITGGRGRIPENEATDFFDITVDQVRLNDLILCFWGHVTCQ